MVRMFYKPATSLCCEALLSAAVMYRIVLRAPWL
jgi:hypothetical protein